MGMTYERFKKLAHGLDFDEKSDEYLMVIEELEKLYENAFEIVYFYPKNVWNEKETELIFFLNDGYLTVKKEKENYQYEQFRCKVVSKSLVKDYYEYNEQQLTIKFDNGKEFFFSSTEDTNKHWVSKYSKSIIDLYKAI
ncbi:hypothetical protein [Bacillus cereus]|uniref:hypothetical protein n=1 Tax=Bacillus sp. GMa5/1 TaxID=3418496 RepID=UPI002DBAB06F|nr:hypothetical protein [Bacillus cereus]